MKCLKSHCFDESLLPSMQSPTTRPCNIKYARISKYRLSLHLLTQCAQVIRAIQHVYVNTKKTKRTIRKRCSPPSLYQVAIQHHMSNQNAYPLQCCEIDSNSLLIGTP